MDERQVDERALPDEDEISLDGMLGDNEPTSKWTAKASVFTSLFSEGEYTLQLYQALHPDDTTTTKDDLVLMTLESHLLNQQYNDLGFLVGDRLIILAEAQSTWSENIVVRALMYVVQTWYKYIKRMKLDVYGRDKVVLPKPELYVIYTGRSPGSKPKEVVLSKSIFGGKTVDVECRVTVLVDGKQGDIISQYVRFCHVLNEQVRLHGRTRKAVDETIKICQDEGVLREFLERQRLEVIDMMLALFDQETMMRNHDAAVEQKGRKEGRQETTALMNYLWSNGRAEDARRASEDEAYLSELLGEFASSADPA